MSAKPLYSTRLITKKMTKINHLLDLDCVKNKKFFTSWRKYEVINDSAVTNSHGVKIQGLFG